MPCRKLKLGRKRSRTTRSGRTPPCPPKSPDPDDLPEVLCFLHLRRALELYKTTRHNLAESNSQVEQIKVERDQLTGVVMLKDLVIQEQHEDIEGLSETINDLQDDLTREMEENDAMRDVLMSQASVPAESQGTWTSLVKKVKAIAGGIGKEGERQDQGRAGSREREERGESLERSQREEQEAEKEVEKERRRLEDALKDRDKALPLESQVKHPSKSDDMDHELISKSEEDGVSSAQGNREDATKDGDKAIAVEFQPREASKSPDKTEGLKGKKKKKGAPNVEASDEKEDRKGKRPFWKTQSKGTKTDKGKVKRAFFSREKRKHKDSQKTKDGGISSPETQAEKALDSPDKEERREKDETEDLPQERHGDEYPKKDRDATVAFRESKAKDVSKSLVEEVDESKAMYVSKSLVEEVDESEAMDVSKSSAEKVVGSKAMDVLKSSAQEVDESKAMYVSKSSAKQVDEPKAKYVSKSPVKEVDETTGKDVPKSSVKEVDETKAMGVSKSSAKEVDHLDVYKAKDVSKFSGKEVDETKTKDVSKSSAMEVVEPAGQEQEVSGHEESGFEDTTEERYKTIIPPETHAKDLTTVDEKLESRTEEEAESVTYTKARERFEEAIRDKDWSIASLEIRVQEGSHSADPKQDSGTGEEEAQTVTYTKERKSFEKVIRDKDRTIASPEIQVQEASRYADQKQKSRTGEEEAESSVTDTKENTKERETFEEVIRKRDRTITALETQVQEASHSEYQKQKSRTGEEEVESVTDTKERESAKEVIRVKDQTIVSLETQVLDASHSADQKQESRAVEEEAESSVTDTKDNTKERESFKEVIRKRDRTIASLESQVQEASESADQKQKSRTGEEEVESVTDTKGRERVKEVIRVKDQTIASVETQDQEASNSGDQKQESRRGVEATVSVTGTKERESFDEFIKRLTERRRTVATLESQVQEASHSADQEQGSRTGVEEAERVTKTKERESFDEFIRRLTERRRTVASLESQVQEASHSTDQKQDSPTGEEEAETVTDAKERESFEEFIRRLTERRRTVASLESDTKDKEVIRDQARTITSPETQIKEASQPADQKQERRTGEEEAETVTDAKETESFEEVIREKDRTIASLETQVKDESNSAEDLRQTLQKHKRRAWVTEVANKELQWKARWLKAELKMMKQIKKKLEKDNYDLRRAQSQKGKSVEGSIKAELVKAPAEKESLIQALLSKDALIMRQRRNVRRSIHNQEELTELLKIVQQKNKEILSVNLRQLKEAHKADLEAVKEKATVAGLRSPLLRSGHTLKKDVDTISRMEEGLIHQIEKNEELQMVVVDNQLTIHRLTTELEAAKIELETLKDTYRTLGCLPNLATHGDDSSVVASPRKKREGSTSTEKKKKGPGSTVVKANSSGSPRTGKATESKIAEHQPSSGKRNKTARLPSEEQHAGGSKVNSLPSADQAHNERFGFIILTESETISLSETDGARGRPSPSVTGKTKRSDKLKKANVAADENESPKHSTPWADDKRDKNSPKAGSEESGFDKASLNISDIFSLPSFSEDSFQHSFESSGGSSSFKKLSPNVESLGALSTPVNERKRQEKGLTPDLMAIPSFEDDGDTSLRTKFSYEDFEMPPLAGNTPAKSGKGPVEVAKTTADFEDTPSRAMMSRHGIPIVRKA